MKTDRQAYWQGAWVPSTEISIPLDDLGFLMGVTVIERLRTFGGKLFRVDSHMQRLRRSLEIMGWDAERLCPKIEAALNSFIERNNPLFAKGDDWSVVAFVTPGKSATATAPTVCVHGGPLPFAAWAEQYESGCRAATVDIRQVPDSCWPAELKCRSRMHYFLADRQAESYQAGARAILLDHDGFVGEASTANVVAYFENRGLVTPLRSKVLPGVTQEVLYELAASLAIPHFEADLLPEEFATADEIFFTSTSICLQPLIQLDGKNVGAGQPGPMYRKLLAAWSDFVGFDIDKQATRFAERRTDIQ